MEVLNFTFRNQSYCIEIARISEVLDSARVTKFPGAPAVFDGLFQLRGRVINLLDFAKTFGQQNDAGEIAIVVFAAPVQQFAVRIPGPVEARSFDFNPTCFPQEAGGIIRILEGTLSDGEKIHHLISVDQLLLYSAELVDRWRMGE